MYYAKLALAGVRWAASALITWSAVVITMIIAPVACLPPFVYLAEEYETTGYPSLFPGEPREFLRSPFHLITTEDSPVDEFWYSDYAHENGWFKDWTQEQYDGSAWKRYVMRVFWCWRNPAYKVKSLLGYSSKGLSYVKMRDEDFLWDSGYDNLSYWLFVNDKGHAGFNLQFQWFYYKTWCLEVILGWGHGTNSPAQIERLASRIIPAKSYHKKP